MGGVVSGGGEGLGGVGGGGGGLLSEGRFWFSNEGRLFVVISTWTPMIVMTSACAQPAESFGPR